VDFARLVRAVRHPLIHFLLIGAVLFALLHRSEPPPEVSDDEVLYREALARGWDRSDPIVRRRLVRNMRFLTPDDERDDGVLLDEALRLGLQHGDLVVRRRLVQRMKLIAWGRADALEPSEAELRATFLRHRDRWAEPPRVRLTHVYLSRDQRGGRLEADALALLARNPSPKEAPGLGDPFLLGAHFPPLSEADLAARFGPEFASAALAVAPRRWSEPVPSSYGLHLLFVHERAPGGEAPFDAVRPALRELVRLERRQEAVRRLVTEFRNATR
jgi:hypothetical protein